MHRRSTATLLVTLLLLTVVGVVPTVVQAGGGCHREVSPPGDGQASVIKIDGCMFYPTISRVPVGTSVRFLNTGNAPHNITGVAGTWASPQLQPGGEFQQTFADPGVYPFACTLHPGMNGAIVVGQDQEAVAAAVVAPPSPGVTPRPVDVTPSGPDLTALAVAALLGLGLGAGSGLVVARRRPSTTA